MKLPGKAVRYIPGLKGDEEVEINDGVEIDHGIGDGSEAMTVPVVERYYYSHTPGYDVARKYGPAPNPSRGAQSGDLRDDH